MKETTAKVEIAMRVASASVSYSKPVLDLYESVKGKSLCDEVIGTNLLEVGEKATEDVRFMSIEMLYSLLKAVPERDRAYIKVLNLSGCYLFDEDWGSVEKVVDLLPSCEVLLLRGCKFRALRAERIRPLLAKLKYIDVNFCRLGSPNREDIFSDLTTEELCKYVVVQSKKDAETGRGWRLCVLEEQEDILKSSYTAYYDTYADVLSSPSVLL